MNEHIKKLAAQALDKVVPYTWSTLDRDEVTKLQEYLAELIVLECANQCDLLLNNKMSSEWTRGTHDCSREIRKYFGVEQ